MTLIEIARKHGITRRQASKIANGQIRRGNSEREEAANPLVYGVFSTALVAALGSKGPDYPKRIGNPSPSASTPKKGKTMRNRSKGRKVAWVRSPRSLAG